MLGGDFFTFAHSEELFYILTEMHDGKKQHFENKFFQIALLDIIANI